jgi:geranylgeranyl reductase family protein
VRHIHDVAVIGAGPGGASTAAWIAQAGLDVVLLDKSDFPRDKTCGDAISPRAVHVLGQLGLMRAVRAAGFRVEGVTVISPAGGRVRVPFAAEGPFGKHAYVIPRYDLDNLILEGAVRAGARFVPRFHVSALAPDEDGLTIHGARVQEPASVQARLAIVAAGANISLLRRSRLLPSDLRFSFAARAYFAGLTGLDRSIHLRFDGVPLPGYGWIFPLSNGTANVGAGFYRRTANTPSTAAAALEAFLAHPTVRPQFVNAERTGPVKGFPLRTDFNRSPTIGPRTMLVGESAGLVNPFTGEGIDYALESGQLAAETAIQCFQSGAFGRQQLHHYDRSLRRRFQHTFVFTQLLRRAYMNAWLLNPLVRAAGRWPAVGDRLLRILSSYQSPLMAFSPVVLARVCAAAVAP